MKTSYATILYGHNLEKSVMDLRGKLNKKNEDFSLSLIVPESLASRDGCSHPVPRRPDYSPYSG